MFECGSKEGFVGSFILAELTAREGIGQEIEAWDDDVWYEVQEAVGLAALEGVKAFEEG